MPSRGEPLLKPEPYKRVKARRKRQGLSARKIARIDCLLRAGWKCERCGVSIFDNVPEWHDQRAQVNELKPKSLGGSNTDPKNLEAVCRRCHFGGPSGAHAPTRARMQRT